MSTLQLARRFALIAGSLDFFTGAGLVLQPELVLRLMHVASPGADALVFLQWVGAFVAAIGASYFRALVRGAEAELCAVFEFTALCRIFVGVFTAWRVIDGSLELAWISVPVSDLGLAGGQFWLWHKLKREHANSR